MIGSRPGKIVISNQPLMWLHSICLYPVEGFCGCCAELCVVGAFAFGPWVVCYGTSKQICMIVTCEQRSFAHHTLFYDADVQHHTRCCTSCEVKTCSFVQYPVRLPHTPDTLVFSFLCNRMHAAVAIVPLQPK